MNDWKVTVTLDGQEVVCISKDWLTHAELTPENQAAIRECIRRLQAFVGDGMRALSKPA